MDAQILFCINYFVRRLKLIVISCSRHIISKADPAPAHRTSDPLFEKKLGCIFENFYSITRINFIVINMQCLQYAFYSLLSLQNIQGICEGASKQSSCRPKKSYHAGTVPPVLKILDPPMSTTEYMA